MLDFFNQMRVQTAQEYYKLVLSILRVV